LNPEDVVSRICLRPDCFKAGSSRKRDEEEFYGKPLIFIYKMKNVLFCAYYALKAAVISNKYL
jgi:hypothetical protein